MKSLKIKKTDEKTEQDKKIITDKEQREQNDEH